MTIVGPPLSTNSGLTYYLGAGLSTQAVTNGASANPYGLNQGAMTVVMAFTTTPSITLTLPIPFDPNSGYSISQVNPLDNTTSVTATPSQLSPDGPRGKITIKSFSSFGGGSQLSASQSFVVQVTPVGQTTPVRFVVHPQPAAAVPGDLCQRGH